MSELEQFKRWAASVDMPDSVLPRAWMAWQASADRAQPAQRIIELEDKQPQAEAVPPAYVLVPIDVLEAASESLGSFVSDNGWTDLDMQAMDNLDAILAQQKGGV